VAVLTCGLLGHAADKTWVGGGAVSPVWTNAAAWSPPGVPTPQDTVLIASGVVFAYGQDRFEVAKLVLSGASTVGFYAPTTITNLVWTGGILATVGSSASVTIPAGGRFEASGSAEKQLATRRFDHFGTGGWTNCTLSLHDEVEFNNYGRLDLVGAVTIANYEAIAPLAINNAGELCKSGPGNAVVHRRVNNQGAVRAKEGQLSFAWYQQTAGLTQIEGGELDCGNSGLRFEGGLLEGSGTIWSGVGANPIRAELNFGRTTGVLRFNGSCAPRGATFVTLGGTAPGMQHDQLQATWGINLGGALGICLAPGYRPGIGDRFEIVRCLNDSYLSGQFRTIWGLDLGGGLYLDPVYGTTNLALVATTGPVRVGWLDVVPCEIGQKLVRFTGTPNTAWRLEATTDFSGWQSLLTNATPSGVLEYLDTTAQTTPWRFFQTTRP
jgi:hypothetical protein